MQFCCNRVCLFGFFAPLPAAAAARHVTNYVAAAAAGLDAAVRPSVTKNTVNQIRNQQMLQKCDSRINKVQGVQVSVHLMTAIQKVDCNTESYK